MRLVSTNTSSLNRGSSHQLAFLSRAVIWVNYQRTLCADSISTADICFNLPHSQISSLVWASVCSAEALSQSPDSLGGLCTVHTIRSQQVSWEILGKLSLPDKRTGTCPFRFICSEHKMWWLELQQLSCNHEGKKAKIINPTNDRDAKSENNYLLF